MWSCVVRLWILCKTTKTQVYFNGITDVRNCGYVFHNSALLVMLLLERIHSSFLNKKKNIPGTVCHDGLKCVF